jgi:hypothetical protein
MFEVDATFLLESGGLGNAKIKATFDFTCSGTCN